MTTDERLEALVKSAEENRRASEQQAESLKRLQATAEEQGRTMDRILAGFDKINESFREFRDDRWHINQSLRTLVNKVDRLTDNVDRLERFFEHSLTKPPNGKTKGKK